VNETETMKKGERERKESEKVNEAERMRRGE
jgi:hypothetical protein